MEIQFLPHTSPFIFTNYNMSFIRKKTPIGSFLLNRSMKMGMTRCPSLYSISGSQGYYYPSVMVMQYSMNPPDTFLGVFSLNAVVISGNDFFLFISLH